MEHKQENMTVEYYLNNDNQKKFFDAMGFEVYELLTLIGEKKVNVLTLDNFIDDKELNEKGLQAYRALAYDQKFEESTRQETRITQEQEEVQEQKPDRYCDVCQMRLTANQTCETESQSTSDTARRNPSR